MGIYKQGFNYKYSLDRDVLVLKTGHGQYKFKIESTELLENVHDIATLILKELQGIEEKQTSGRDDMSHYAKLLLATLNICEKYTKLEKKYKEVRHVMEGFQALKSDLKQATSPRTPVYNSPPKYKNDGEQQRNTPVKSKQERMRSPYDGQVSRPRYGANSTPPISSAYGTAKSVHAVQAAGVENKGFTETGQANRHSARPETATSLSSGLAPSNSSDMPTAQAGSPPQSPSELHGKTEISSTQPEKVRSESQSLLPQQQIRTEGSIVIKRIETGGQTTASTRPVTAEKPDMWRTSTAATPRSVASGLVHADPPAAGKADGFVRGNSAEPVASSRIVEDKVGSSICEFEKAAKKMLDRFPVTNANHGDDVQGPGAQTAVAGRQEALTAPAPPDEVTENTENEEVVEQSNGAEPENSMPDITGRQPEPVTGNVSDVPSTSGSASSVPMVVSEEHSSSPAAQDESRQFTGMVDKTAGEPVDVPEPDKQLIETVSRQPVHTSDTGFDVPLSSAHAVSGSTVQPGVAVAEGSDLSESAGDLHKPLPDGEVNEEHASVGTDTGNPSLSSKTENAHTVITQDTGEDAAVSDSSPMLTEEDDAPESSPLPQVSLQSVDDALFVTSADMVESAEPASAVHREDFGNTEDCLQQEEGDTNDLPDDSSFQEWLAGTEENYEDVTDVPRFFSKTTVQETFTATRPQAGHWSEQVDPDEVDRQYGAKSSSDEYQLPLISFLRNTSSENQVDQNRIRSDAELLEKKLGYFGIKGEVMGIHPGPVITTYEYKPDPGIKISKIVNLADDLALALSAYSIRIVAPIPGKDVMGIEIPNIQKSLVPFIDIVTSEDFQTSTSRIPICLGKDIVGNPVVVELDSMPHLLIAGATGTGKSVGLNAMITSILYKATPDEVRFLMIDPKRIELSFYNDIPHLLTPVITDMNKANTALQWMVREMDRRYNLLAEYQVRHIEQFNQKLFDSETELYDENDEKLEPLPYIVVIIDELADLMMTASRDIEFSLTRLAQMARAAGIHLILATQRPSVDVLTGIIKANFPTRISFQVSSKTDSRTIIDSNGAETLLGNGDMLFVPPGTARLTRVHGTYLSEDELVDITTFIKQQQKPNYIFDVLTDQGNDDVDLNGGNQDEYDEKYNEALEFVMSTRQASISGVQRALRVGYNRAARIIDLMEKNGVVGPSDGVKPRKVLVNTMNMM